MIFKRLGKSVGDLINGDAVIVLHTEGYYKGGNTTTVRYELADFMDDSPPFIEVCFINKEDECVYFTSNLEELIYEIDGMFCVKGLNGEHHG